MEIGEGVGMIGKRGVAVVIAPAFLSGKDVRKVLQLKKKI